MFFDSKWQRKALHEETVFPNYKIKNIIKIHLSQWDKISLKT